MAATTFAWSGEITSTFQTDFATAAEGVATANVTLGVTINDNLSFTGLVITTAVGSNGATTALTNGNAAYYATVNLGGVLGLDPKVIAEKLSIGSWDVAGTAYGVTGYANEEVWGADMTGGPLAIGSLTTINNMVNVYLAFDPASLFGTPAYIADVYGVFGPISASVAYGSNQQESLNVTFAQTMGDIAIGVGVGENYNLGASTYNIGFGAKVAYKTLVTFGAATSYGSAGLGTLDVNVNIAPSATMGIDLWTIVDLANGGFTATAGYLDASVWTKLDASTLRLGYVYTAQTAAAGYYVARLATGGLYFLYDLTF